MSEFFEAIWQGEGIGDGGDLDEALQSFVAVKPDDGDWVAACAADGASPGDNGYYRTDVPVDGVVAGHNQSFRPNFVFLMKNI